MAENWRTGPSNDSKIKKYMNELSELWDKSNDSTLVKLTEFTKYVPKTSLIQFIGRYELYKIIKDIPGDILEIGVCGGSGLFSFIQSVFINEPDYQWRNIIGFDTFEGFVGINDKDNINISSEVKNIGSYKSDSYDEIIQLKNVHQNFRFINNRDQIYLVKGDVCETIPEYLKTHQGLIISMLYIDVDLYEPTKTCLQLLWERIPKGGIVVFDDAIMHEWEGEAIALHEILGIGNSRLVRIHNLKQFYIIKE